jgi:hypothetical protein
MTMANNDSDLDDAELPDESDMDQDDEDEIAEAQSCLHCGELMLHPDDACPQCGAYASPERALASRKPLWFVTAAIFCLWVVWEIWIR